MLEGGGRIGSIDLPPQESEETMWILWLFVPALVVFAVHLTVLAAWQRATTWRIRRRVTSALDTGDDRSLRIAAREASVAQADWQSQELSTLSKAIDITLRRAQ